MRIVGVGLLLLCPVLAGCSLFQKKRNDTAQGTGASNPAAFPGSSSPRFPDRGSGTGRDETAAAQVSYSGLLAGYVRDRFGKYDGRSNRGFVQLVDLNGGDDKSKIDMALDEQGQFAIPRLIPGHSYKLIARVNDGARLMAGSSQATAPNPKIYIEVSEDLVSPDTPPIPPVQPLPGRKPNPPEKEKETKPSSPAGLGTPIPNRDVPSPSDPGTRSQPPEPVPGGAVDRSSIAQEQGGFRRAPSPTVTIPSVPGPTDTLPPPPVIPIPRAPERTPAPPQPRETSSGEPSISATVPSCLLVGNKLENFALYDLEGKPWEFRKDHKGRLMLLHFWSTTSTASLAGLKDLRNLQATYDSFGLQLISIAYEEGPWADQVQKVSNVRVRNGLFKFVSLLGGGGKGTCPVRDQFRVEKLPELVLLSADGQILWHASQPDADRLTELRILVKRQLGVNE